MMKSNNNNKYLSHLRKSSWLGLFAVLLVWGTSCSKMDDTYRDFWENGEIIYPAIADSIKVYPGKNRLKISWLIRGDASITRAKIYWNSNRDSLEVPIQSTGQIDTISVILDDMAEGFYVFDILTFDREGNESLKTSATGTVYGENYSRYLLNRVIRKALFKDNVLSVIWGPTGDETAVASEIKYTDASGNEHWMQTAPESDTTLVGNYDFDRNDGHILSRTMYVPPLSIDTFFTALDTTRVIGPPVPLSQAGWTATDNQLAIKPGYEPGKAIDGDIQTTWWTPPGSLFPYIFTVDMGEEKGPLNGLYMQSTRKDPRIKKFKLEVSNDGAEWRGLGVFDNEDNADYHYYEFISQEQFRYFRVVCPDPADVYRDKPYCAISEVGVYRR